MQHMMTTSLPSYSAKNPLPLVPPLEFLYSIHIRVSEEMRVSGILFPQNRPVGSRKATNYKTFLVSPCKKSTN